LNAEDQDRDARLSKLAGLIFLLSYGVSCWIALEVQRTTTPGSFDNPPWYFIRQDAIMGLSFLPLFLTCAAAIFLAMRRKFTQTARTLLGMGFFVFYPVWKLLVIYVKCDDLFDPAKARTSWTTFDSYMHDPWNWGWLAVVFFLALNDLIRRFRRRRLAKAVS
jgi:hypothetical protein